jgi:phage repressor protein C with HTH and peptisase S24 domain
MLRLLKVSGRSLWPLYEDGDYVLAVHPRLAGPIRPGDVVVFRNPVYGTMIKQVERLLPESDEIYVVGTHDQSVDSRQFGAISRQAVIGKVICRIKR